MSLETLKSTAARWSLSNRCPRLVGLARRLFFWAFVGFLAWRLTSIGWSQIVEVLPSSPCFYVISLILYVQLVVSHALAYRVSWRFPIWQGLPAFFKMVMYNKEVVGNAGEVYLGAWARRLLKLPTGAVIRVVKDNIILQWLCETAWAFSLPCLLLFPSLSGEAEGYRAIYPLALPAILGLGLATVAYFRRTLFSLPDRAITAVTLIHLGRLLLVNLLTLAQWSLAMPDASLQVRLTMLVFWNLVNWIPYLPNKGLLVMYTGIEAAGSMGLPAAGIAGILLVNSVLEKCLNLVAFPLCNLLDRVESSPEGTAKAIPPAVPAHFGSAGVLCDVVR